VLGGRKGSLWVRERKKNLIRAGAERAEILRDGSGQKISTRAGF